MSAGLNGKWNICRKGCLEFCWHWHWERQWNWERWWSSPGAGAERWSGLSLVWAVSEGEGIINPFRSLNVFQLEKLLLRGKRVHLAMLLKHPGWNQGCITSNTACGQACVPWERRRRRRRKQHEKPPAPLLPMQKRQCCEQARDTRAEDGDVEEAEGHWRSLGAIPLPPQCPVPCHTAPLACATTRPPLHEVP